MSKESKPVPTGYHTFKATVKGWGVEVTCNLPDPIFTQVILTRGDTRLTIIPVAPDGGFDCIDGDSPAINVSGPDMESWLDNRDCNLTPSDIYKVIGQESRKMGLELIEVSDVPVDGEAARKILDALRKVLTA